MFRSVPQMPATNIDNRIRRVTEDLRALHQELQQLGLSAVDTGKHDQLLDRLLTLEVIQDFKAAIDHMRHFLGAYIESASKDMADERSLTMHNLLMERATEMLRVLRERLDGPGIRKGSRAIPFLAEIQTIDVAPIMRQLTRTTPRS